MIALIPAKGTSERIPRKNMASLGGRPLLDWTIDAALQAGCFEDIIVSSEDEEILDHARGRGVSAIRRSAALSMPDATIADVVAAMRRSDLLNGPVYILVPTSPFRRPETIHRVCAMAAADKDWSIMSVRVANHPLTVLSMIPAEGDDSLWPWDGMALWEMPRKYRRDVYIHEGGHWVIQGARRWRPFRTPDDEILDIDTPRDLAFAEFLLETGRVPWLTSAKTSR